MTPVRTLGARERPWSVSIEPMPARTGHGTPYGSLWAYDAAGDLACRIGLPIKTGVGGGIVAIVPGRLCVCAWAPGLDANGNSIAAAAAIERFAAAIGASIFAGDTSHD